LGVLSLYYIALYVMLEDCTATIMFIDLKI